METYSLFAREVFLLAHELMCKVEQAHCFSLGRHHVVQKSQVVLEKVDRRRIIDRLRSQGRTRAREVALNLEHETFCAPEANLGGADWNKRVLGDAIASLPPGQREAVRLLKLQEMSLQQAAAASGMSVAALKVAMHRALKNLRKILTQSSDEK